MDAWKIKEGMRLDHYKALADYREVAKANGEWEKLTDEQKRFVDKCILEKERDGLALPEDQREAVGKLKQEIADLERKASQNINEDKTKTECAVAELDGLKEDFISKLEKVEGKEGYVYISLKYPEIFPALKNVKSGEVRKRLDKAKGSQCRIENAPILEELVTKRQKYAEMLGYKSYSKYVLEERMAKEPKNVQNFEESLTKKILAKGKSEFEALRSIKREEEKDPNADFYSYDRFYYENLQKQRFFSVDEEEIKKYFPMTQVVTETLKIYQELFSLKFTKIEAQVWHEEVEAYQVNDATTDELIGHFYMDLFPRDNKFGHAAAFPLIMRCDLGKGVLPSAAAMVCNFDKPTAD
jgi:Zn-dependent oligopeptidase